MSNKNLPIVINWDGWDDLPPMPQLKKKSLRHDYFKFYYLCNREKILENMKEYYAEKHTSVEKIDKHIKEKQYNMSKNGGLQERQDLRDS